MAKRRLNLSVDERAIQRGKRYSERHNTSVSQLVNDFLSGLPAENGETVGVELTPAVRRLVGIGKGEADEADYHRHLLEKYGK